VLLRGKDRKKECGILLPLSSLPSKYGIGSLGDEAYRFIDLLENCKQQYWQMLPLCPVGKGNSPYSSSSCFAGEILYIDLDELSESGLLKKCDIKKQQFSDKIDYRKVREYKLPLLKKAAKNFDIKNKEYQNFEAENKYWLEDFAVFMAIKENLGGESFLNWERSLKFRDASAIENFKATHTDSLLFYKITQYFFFSQYDKLHQYANSHGIKIIGDIPFYVSLESADVWQNPQFFKLGKDLTPVLVAGVPPDIFSSTGQLWGNPVYNWEQLKNTNYYWWRQRLIHNARLYDHIRIDHFRAFADYYTIPAGANNAVAGQWKKGVGTHFWQTVKPFIPNCQIIAEDLGGENSPLVKRLLDDTGFPNMKVLQFAFNSDCNNIFLPKNFGFNCVCYTGTHDNDTTLGWYDSLTESEQNNFEKVVPKSKFDSPALRLIAFAMKSNAKIVIIPLQDYLQKDSSCRINTPGKATANWEWRFTAQDITAELIKTIIKLSKLR